jgi:hypothetical protein
MWTSVEEPPAEHSKAPPKRHSHCSPAFLCSIDRHQRTPTNGRLLPAPKHCSAGGESCDHSGLAERVEADRSVPSSPATGSLTMSDAPTLTLLEARVLGVLVEKEKTVPDTYPLSLNALTAGCNQKNNRDPVMSAAESEVQAAVDELKRRSMVIESSGSRVMRYAHNVGRVLRVPEQSVAILATLMLRGPQTAGELRIATERLHRFADISSVEAFLDELAARDEAHGGPLAAKLPRQPGEREQRWAQLLTGPPQAADAAEDPREEAGLRQQVQRLAAEVESLRAEVASLREQLARGGVT